MGKSCLSLSKFMRLKKLLTYLEMNAQERGVSCGQVFEYMKTVSAGVTKRTIYRDLEELSLNFPLVDSVDPKGNVTWVYQKFNQSSFSEIQSYK
jgi:hypothetical protein